MKLYKMLSVAVFGLTLSLIASAGLETGTFIDSLNVANPLNTDSASQGDDHIRLVKSTIKNTFPNINAAVTVTDENLNAILSASSFTSGTVAEARGGTGNGSGVARNVSAKTGTAKTLSTLAASGGADGDIWYRY